MEPNYEWYGLDAVGFPDWEHTHAECTPERRAGPLLDGPGLQCFIRPKGCRIPVLVRSHRGGLLKEITRLIDRHDELRAANGRSRSLPHQSPARRRDPLIDWEALVQAMNKQMMVGGA